MPETPATKDHRGRMVHRELQDLLVRQGLVVTVDLRVQTASLEFPDLLDPLVHRDLLVREEKLDSLGHPDRVETQDHLDLLDHLVHQAHEDLEEVQDQQDCRDLKVVLDSLAHRDNKV